MGQGSLSACTSSKRRLCGGKQTWIVGRRVEVMNARVGHTVQLEASGLSERHV